MKYDSNRKRVLKQCGRCARLATNWAGDYNEFAFCPECWKEWVMFLASLEPFPRNNTWKKVWMKRYMDFLIGRKDIDYREGEFGLERKRPQTAGLMSSLYRKRPDKLKGGVVSYGIRV